MLSVFYYAFSAVMPIILMILVGVLARRTGYLTKNLLRGINKFTFRFAFFAMMFVNIYEIESISEMPLDLAAFSLFSLTLLLLIGFVFASIITKEKFRRGVLIQATFRSNYAVIGLPVVTTLVGDAGLRVASFLQLPVVIFYNFMSVIVLSLYEDYEAQYRLYGEGPLADAAGKKSSAEHSEKKVPAEHGEKKALDEHGGKKVPAEHGGKKALAVPGGINPLTDVREKKTLTDAGEKNTSAAVGENSTSGNVREKNTSAAVGENSTSGNVREKNTSAAVGENSTSGTVGEKKTSAAVGGESAVKAAAGKNRNSTFEMLFRILKGTASNPLIQGLMLGFVVLIIRQFMPVRGDGEIVFSLKRDLPWFYDCIRSLSRVATPMALIILGGQLEMKEIGSYRKELIAGILMRLVGAPVIGFSLLFAAVRMGLLTVSPVETAVFVAVFASPLSVSSIVMSQEMGGDSHLAGQIVVWTSIFGMFSLFVLIFLLRMQGLL